MATKIKNELRKWTFVFYFADAKGFLSYKVRMVTKAMNFTDFEKTLKEEKNKDKPGMIEIEDRVYWKIKKESP